MNVRALNVAIALTVSIAAASPVRADGGASPWREDGVLLLRSADDAFSLQLDGRVFLDFGFHTAADGLTTAADARRARLGLKLRLWRDWRTEWDIDVADGEVELKDLWIGYDLSDTASIKVGHFKIPFSLDELMSSRTLVNLERALPNVFAHGRRLAIGASASGDWWRVHGALYGQEIAKPEETTRSEGFGGALRLTFAPIHDELALLHLGVAGALETPDDGGDRVRFDTRPETKVMRYAFLDTGVIDGVSLTGLVGIETAARYGPVTFQGEGILAQVVRGGDRAAVTLSGFYMMVAWLVTGQVRPYDPGDGELAGLGAASHGAVELTLRYSHLDLNDVHADDPADRVTGGAGNQLSVGVNWYFNPNVRWMLGYSRVDNSDNANGAGGLPDGLDRQFHLVTTRLYAGF